MTSKVAVISAAVFHYCIRFAIFITPETLIDCNHTRIGGFPALIILIGICVFLTDIEVFSNQYNKYSTVTFRVVETILALLAIEFSMIMVWNRIENGLVSLIKHILSRGDLYQEMGGDNFTALILSGVSICFLMFAINISNSSEKFAKLLVGTFDAVVGYYNKLKAMRCKSQSMPCPLNATLYKCHPVEVLQPPSASVNRNPCCPIHGDSEVNSSVITRSRKKN